MKQILILAVLVAVANAYSIEALKEMMNELERRDSVTLREYLDSLETPDPTYKVSSKRSLDEREEIDCSNVCGPVPTLNLGQSCLSNRWKPNYAKKGESCECLTEYRCCTDDCPTVTTDTCLGEDKSEKGRMYGVIPEDEKDCCGCDLVRCFKCHDPMPEEERCPRGNGSRPTDCYTYTKNDHHRDSPDQCFESECVENASDAPPNAECDGRCQGPKTVMSHCQFDYKVCKATKVIGDCPRKEKQTAIDELELPLMCYEEPVKVSDEDGGHYAKVGDLSCQKCTKWVYTAKSCADKNAAAAAVDCHQYGANKMDKKCFVKKTKQDSCTCDVAECIANSVEEPDVFVESEVCPKDHVKMAGVSICMKERELCKQCPALVEMTAEQCKVGKILKAQDCIGCPKYVCEQPKVPECECEKYTLDKENNALKCAC